MKIPTSRNTIFVRHTGDGFRHLVLPSLLYHEILVVTTKMRIETFYKHCKGYKKNVTTIHRLDKVNDKNMKVILIDCLIPRETSKAFKKLKELCTEKQICFVQLPHDPQALAGAIELISATKNPNTKIFHFNQFAYLRGYQ